MSPFTAADGSMYVAQKTSRVIAVDPQTGSLRYQYAVAGPGIAGRVGGAVNDSVDRDDVDEDDDGRPFGAGAEGSTGEDTGVVFVGRTELTVTCYGRDGTLRWNLTHAEYAQAAGRAGSLDFFHQVYDSLRSPEVHFVPLLPSFVPSLFPCPSCSPFPSTIPLCP
jgi:hypothetical protein